MKALVVSGGEEPSSQELTKYANLSDIIIGVDKGCQYLYDNNIVPDFIVGDFDSSNIDVINYFDKKGSKKYQFKPEKDSTDSDIAFSLLLDMKVDEVFFLGAMGKRFDHTMGNIGLLLKALDENIDSSIIDNNNLITLINKSSRLKKIEEYKYISFLAYNSNIEEFTIKNAKYNLINYNLKVGDNRTISNEFKNDYIDISFKSGIILVIYSKDSNV